MAWMKNGTINAEIETEYRLYRRPKVCSIVIGHRLMAWTKIGHQRRSPDSGGLQPNIDGEVPGPQEIHPLPRHGDVLFYQTNAGHQVPGEQLSRHFVIALPDKFKTLDVRHDDEYVACHVITKTPLPHKVHMSIGPQHEPPPVFSPFSASKLFALQAVTVVSCEGIEPFKFKVGSGITCLAPRKIHRGCLMSSDKVQVRLNEESLAFLVEDTQRLGKNNWWKTREDNYGQFWSWHNQLDWKAFQVRTVRVADWSMVHPWLEIQHLDLGEGEIADIDEHLYLEEEHAGSHFSVPA